MPSHANCVVPGCPNRKDRCKWGLFPSKDKVLGRDVYCRRRLCGSNLDKVGCGNTAELCKAVSFFRLPKEGKRRGELRTKWLSRIPRKNTPLTSNSYVCGVHFPSGKPDDQHDSPCIFLDKPLVRKRSTRVSASGDFRAESVALSSESGVDEEPAIEMSVEEVTGLPSPSMQDMVDEHCKSRMEDQRKRIIDLEKQVQCLENLLADSRAEAEALKFSVTKLKTDSDRFHFYTGLSPEAFGDVLNLVGPAADSMIYGKVADDSHSGKRRSTRTLNNETELLLTLMKLRHDFPEGDLGQRFGISQSTVSRIFSTWIVCLHHTFKEIDIWPSRNLVDRYMPKEFKEKFPSTRVIIDATEFPLEKPANPDVQAATWSNYKNRNTLKLLVGVSPNGAITFLSPLYGGRISDKEITKRSNLLSLLSPGDSIMADRGFDIATIMPEGTDVNIPPFLAGREQLEHQELIQTRRIASVRIHVERAIERVKNYNITKYFSASIAPLAEQIVFVCSFLTLFQPPLVPPPEP